uniref:Uncharacterized protein n=1 Tax=Bactrocera dorsalis TaxID=27457 RepID=A0A034WNM0_BACDO
MATSPIISKIIEPTKRMAPQAVKSMAVCMANTVSTRTTSVVMPSEYRTVSGEYLMAIQPSKNDSANVKSISSMKFSGKLRRTPSQHAIGIMMATMQPNATHISQGRSSTKSCIAST